MGCGGKVAESDRDGGDAGGIGRGYIKGIRVLI